MRSFVSLPPVTYASLGMPPRAHPELASLSFSYIAFGSQLLAPVGTSWSNQPSTRTESPFHTKFLRHNATPIREPPPTVSRGTAVLRCEIDEE